VLPDGGGGVEPRGKVRACIISGGGVVVHAYSYDLRARARTDQDGSGGVRTN